MPTVLEEYAKPAPNTALGGAPSAGRTVLEQFATGAERLPSAPAPGRTLLDEYAVPRAAPIPAGAAPATQPPEPSTVLGEAKRGWEAGTLETQRGHIGGGIVFNEISEADGIRRAAALQEKINAIPPTTWDWSRPETWLPDLAHTTARTAPFMWESTVKGGAYGLAAGIAAGTAAAIGGQTGPQIALPEEVVTVPTATAGGMAVGMAVGVIENTMRVEAGNAYLDMRQRGIDASLAKPAAVAVGVVNGFIEVSQIGAILRRVPGARKFFTETLKNVVLKNGTVRKVLAGVAVDYLKVLGEEVSEEVAQGWMTNAGGAAAGAIQAVRDDTAYLGPTWTDVLQDTIDNLKSGEAFALMPLPGAAAQTGRGLLTLRGERQQAGAKAEGPGAAPAPAAGAPATPKPSAEGVEVSPAVQKAVDALPDDVRADLAGRQQLSRTDLAELEALQGALKKQGVVADSRRVRSAILEAARRPKQAPGPAGGAAEGERPTAAAVGARPVAGQPGALPGPLEAKTPPEAAGEAPAVESRPAGKGEGEYWRAGVVTEEIRNEKGVTITTVPGKVNWIKVEKAKPIDIPGFEDLDTFLAKDERGGWFVLEGQTGQRLGNQPGKTQAEAVKLATGELTRYGREKALEAIQHAMKSPRAGKWQPAPQKPAAGKPGLVEAKPAPAAEEVKPRPGIEEALSRVEAWQQREATPAAAVDWASAKPGTILHINEADYEVLHRNVRPKKEARRLAAAAGAETWIDGPDYWAVVRRMPKKAESLASTAPAPPAKPKKVLKRVTPAVAPAVTVKAPGILGNLSAEDQQAAAEALEQFKKALRRPSMTLGLPDPEILTAGSKYGYYLLKNGTIGFQKWGAAMIRAAGEEVRPYLKGIWLYLRNLPLVGEKVYDAIQMEPEGILTDDYIDEALRKGLAETEPPTVESVGEQTHAERPETAGGRVDTGRPEHPAGLGAGPAEGGGVPTAPGPTRPGGERGQPARDRTHGRPSPPRRQPARGNLPGPSGGTVPAGPAGTGPRVTRGAGGKPNYRYTDQGILSYGKGGTKTRYNANVRAIRLLHKIEAEARSATPDEQEVLAAYVGWGAMKQAFDPTNAKWTDEFNELKALLTPEEYRQARASRLNAHFTAPEIAKAMWQGLQALGFKGGRICEPSVGHGIFLGTAPAEIMANSQVVGIDMDSLSARIARQLYQSADVLESPYERFKTADNYFDVFISNVPFSEASPFDPDMRNVKFPLHNFYFAKSLAKTRPGGLVVFITTHNTLDAKGNTARAYMAKRADLVAAIRLPRTAFERAARTEVVTDILVFQKRPEGIAKRAGIDFETVETAKIGAHEYPVNAYFLKGPGAKNILGVQSDQGKMWKENEYTVLPPTGYEGDALMSYLAERVRSIIGGAVLPHGLNEASDQAQQDFAKTDFSEPAPKNVRRGSFIVHRGELVQNVDGLLQPANVGDEAHVRALVGLRDAAHRQIHLEQDENSTDADIEAARKDLNGVYDAFVKEHGYLSLDKNMDAFKEDPDLALLLSLEFFDEDTQQGQKAAIFSHRTSHPVKVVTTAETAADGLAASLNQRGHVDLDYIHQLTGKPKEVVISDLTGVIFQDPERGWVTADEYLSGAVRQKLAAAKDAAAKDPRFQENVKALELVQPPHKPISRIDLDLGQGWIPYEVYEGFVKHAVGREDIGFGYMPNSAQWVIDGRTDINSDDEIRRWGTEDRPFLRLIREMMNGQPTEVRRENPDGTTSRDEQATADALMKREQIQAEFTRWTKSDPNRAVQIEDIYNDRFNDSVPARFDGKHLTLPGLATWVRENAVKPYKHQRDAIWRAICSRVVLLAHKVGYGKTLTIVAACMEKQRLGLTKKAVVVVPNHIVGQWARAFAELYPGARVLVAMEGDLGKENRQQFAYRVATGDWNAVIIPETNFTALPMSPQFLEDFLHRQIDEVRRAKEEAQAAEKREAYQTGRKRLARGSPAHALEVAEQNLKARLDRLRAEHRHDEGPFFEELGLDDLYVDESQNFKNLWFPTRMRMPGIQVSNVQRSFDLWMKTTYLNSRGQRVTFATGTPIANAVTEAFSLQRYLQPEFLDANGLEAFDAWAHSFGLPETDWESDPTGQMIRQKQRFSKFRNRSDLQHIMRAVMDVMMDAPAELQGIPKIKGGRAQEIVCEPSENQQSYFDGLVERFEAVRHAGKPEKGADNALTCTNDGRMAALDLRLISDVYPENPDGKINKCAENVAEIYKTTAPLRGVQIVWCDLGVPKKKKLKKAAPAAEAGVEDAPGSPGGLWTDNAEAHTRFSVYDELKRKLVEQGVKADEIAFVHEYARDTVEGLYRKLRSGEIRVVVASTARMGTGANVQDRVVAEHHLDAPYRPDWIEQRTGRMVRPGNKIVQEVGSYRYITKGSFDTYLWQMLERKATFIMQFLLDVAEEDVELAPVVLDFAAAKASAAQDPQFMEWIKLDGEVARIASEERAHQDTLAVRARQAASLPAEISHYEDLAGMLERENAVAAQTLEGKGEADIVATIAGTPYTKRKEAGEALKMALDELAAKPGGLSGEPTEIGTLSGLPFSVFWDKVRKNPQWTFFVGAPGIHTPAELGDDVLGRVVRIEHEVKNIPERIKRLRELTAETRKKLEVAETRMREPFEREAELVEKRERYANLTATLAEKAKEYERRRGLGGLRPPPGSHGGPGTAGVRQPRTPKRGGPGEAAHPPAAEEGREAPAGDQPEGSEAPDIEGALERLHRDEVGAVPVGRIVEATADLVTEGLQSGVRGGNWFTGSMAWLLSRTAAGRRLVAALNRSSTQTDILKGKIENELHDAWKALTAADRKWMKAVDKDGLSNWRKVVEEQIELPKDRPGLVRFLGMWDKMMELTGKEAERVGILRRGREGFVEPFRRAKVGRLIRAPTPDAVDAMWRQSGPVYEELMETILDLNPEMTERRLRNILDEWLGPKSERKMGSLESVRKIPVFPDYVKVGRKWIAVLETQPFILFRKSMDRMARRTYFIENLGQGLLWRIRTGSLYRLAKLVGVPLKFGMKRAALLEALGKVDAEALVTPETRATLRAKAKKILSEEDYKKTRDMPAKELRALLGARGVTVGLTKRRLESLRLLARKWGGFDNRTPDAEILGWMIARAEQDADQYVAQLRDQHVKAGGEAKDFDNVIRVWFGRPFGVFADRGRMRSMPRRIARTFSALIGASQTSLSVAPNIPQPFSQVPRYVGWRRTLTAYWHALRHPKLTAAQVSALGANPRSIMDWSVRPGYIPEDVAKIIRGAVSRATGLHWIAELNNLVTAKAFLDMADYWRKHGAEEGDLATMKDLRLTEGEIAAARRGDIGEELYAKIVQNGVKITQYITEDPHQRSAMQNDVFFNGLFAYNSYAVGTAKASGRMVREIRDACKKGASREVRLAAARHLINLVVGSAGAGVASVLLRRVVKGQPILPPDEDWWDLLLSGLWEIQLLGPAQRMIDSGFYDNGKIERWLVGLAPQLTAVLDALGALIGGYGTYGKFPVEQRVHKVILRSVPAYRAAYNWTMNLAYPQARVIRHVRAQSWAWAEKNLGKERYQGEYQKNPLYVPVQEAADNLDYDGARAAADAYFAKFQEGDERDHARTNLRLSLMAKRPISLSEGDVQKFLASLPEQEAREASAAQQEYLRLVNVLAPTKTKKLQRTGRTGFVTTVH